MSVRFDATGDRLKRTATVPAFGDFSCMFWVYRASDTGDTETLFAISASGSGASIGCYIDGSGGDKLGTWTSAFATAAGSGAAMSVTTWYRVAVVFDNTANTLKIYQGDNDPTTAMSEVGSVADTGSFTTDTIGFPFHYLSGGSWFNGRIGNVKLYTAVKSAAFLKTELQYFNVQDSTNVWGAWTCKTETATITDTTGNGRSLTGTSLTSEADPPITDSPGGGGGKPDAYYRMLRM